MTNAQPLELPYPTCAQCAGIGLDTAPQWQWDMEDELGFDVLKALILAHGGRELSIWCRLPETVESPLDQAQAWLRNRFGSGKMIIQFGPLARRNRIAWLTYTMLRDGASLAQVAARLDVTVRTICRHKKRLQDMGALPAPAPSNTRRT